MGLDLHVGILSALGELGEPEGVDRYRQQFQKVNLHLIAKGLPAHHEPDGGAIWEARIGSPSDLHELRRVAVHLLTGRDPPAPAVGHAGTDPLLVAYYAERQYRPAVSHAATPPPHLPRSGFRHLLLHSDVEGFYLPLNLRFVLQPPAELGVWGGLVGSSFRLVEECRALAKALRLPAGLGPASAEFNRLCELVPDPDEPLPWRRLPIAARACATLLKGAVRSVELGAALVFA